MCTAATYKTKDFYFGRTLDYEFSYGDEITITPRNFPFKFRHTNECNSHFAMIGMAHIADGYPLYYDAMSSFRIYFHIATAFCRQEKSLKTLT